MQRSSEGEGEICMSLTKLSQASWFTYLTMHTHMHTDTHTHMHTDAHTHAHRRTFHVFMLSLK